MQRIRQRRAIIKGLSCRVTGDLTYLGAHGILWAKSCAPTHCKALRARLAAFGIAMTPQEIRQWRKGKGLTQHQAAEQLGISWRQYQRLESGDSQITGPIERIVKLLGN